MGLSSELISKFVKATKDETSVKPDTIAYGTVQLTNGELSLQLDGSNTSIPIADSTIDTDKGLKPGNRVMVLIKNHKAVVIGNLTSQSITVDGVQFELGKIDAIEADNIKINNKLTAQEGAIGELSVDYGEFKEATADRLEAAEAVIDTLEAGSVTAEQIAATYATIDGLKATNGDIYNLKTIYAAAERMTVAEGSIEELEANDAEITGRLEAAEADIDDLEANVANIDTLIFGSASGNTMHVSFANAIIALLGDAWIKSAMIESVSADKITSSEINVVSDEGSLVISDGTIQVSDDARIRVQIGKDASNDYSINVWDQNGALMFSKGGITDAAIKDAIIRDDMVSDTANISAHKLNIDSLFEEINDSSKTIKSSKIYLDEEKQTLDVAFGSLESAVSEQGETISAQGTDISVIKGKIDSKVWQQDINSATNAMSSQYSSLEQEVDGISATVASHTTQISKKADSSAVTEVNTKISELETDLEGFRTTVSETYATKNEVDNLETAISQNSKNIELRATKTEMATAKAEAISSANSNTANKLSEYSTTSEMEAAIKLESDRISSSVKSTYATISDVTNAQATADSAQESIDNLAVGGRNYLLNSDYERICNRGTVDFTISKDLDWVKSNEGKTVALSFDAKGNEECTYQIDAYFRGDVTSFNQNSKVHTLTTEYARYSQTMVIPAIPDDDTSVVIRIRGNQYVGNQTNVGNFYVRNAKLELGNVDTDWTPAPEEMGTAQDTEKAQTTANEALGTATNAETLVQQLADSISMLVTDGNGTSLMTQTEDGWTFSTAHIQELVNKTSEDLSNLTDEFDDIDSAVGILQQAVKDLGATSEYIRIGTYEGEPCIELGENDSDFKLIITNTRIMFMEGTSAPAYINNQSLYITKAVIEEELQQGSFVWKVRANGNMGLMWKGGV